MFTWLAFINACLFLTLATFTVTAHNFFHLLLAAEISWVVLYTLAGVFGVFIDDAGVLSLTFFSLGLAAVELCFGLLLILLMRHFKLSLSLSKINKKDYANIFLSIAKSARKRRV